ncbi:mCG64976, partial [Mus musculus]
SEDSQHCPPRPSVAGGPHLFPATGDQVTGPTTTLLECEASIATHTSCFLSEGSVGTGDSEPQLCC